jgi:hypothetical protein
MCGNATERSWHPSPTTSLSVKRLHSSRSSIAGSTERARCAGIQVASNPSKPIARTTQLTPEDRANWPDIRWKRAPGSPEFPEAIRPQNQRLALLQRVHQSCGCDRANRDNRDTNDSGIYRFRAGEGRGSLREARSNGRRINPFKALKTTALAPIATASVNTATAVNPGFFFSMRIPNRKSCQSVSMGASSEIGSLLARILPTFVCFN